MFKKTGLTLAVLGALAVSFNVQAQQQLRAPVFEDKVVDHLVGLAKVTDKEISKEKLQKAVEALDEM